MAKQDPAKLVSECCKAEVRKNQKREGFRCTKCKKDCNTLKEEAKAAPEAQKPTQEESKGRMTGKEEEYAYTIKDKAFGELPVLNSANAWWLDKGKVVALIEAYKIDATNEQACFNAGISIDQLRYFNEMHPDFSRIKQACKQNLGFIAKQNLAKEIKKNTNGRSAWYLERTEKDKYSSRSELTGGNGRELFDGISEEMRKIGEEVRNAGHVPAKV